MILLNIGPLIGTEINKNITYNPDFYQHATGANQILQEKKISFENDNRLYWNSQTDLFYPPGFMIYLSVVSGLTNVPVLYLPIILTTIDWIIFIIMVLTG